MSVRHSKLSVFGFAFGNGCSCLSAAEEITPEGFWIDLIVLFQSLLLLRMRKCCWHQYAQFLSQACNFFLRYQAMALSLWLLHTLLNIWIFTYWTLYRPFVWRDQSVRAREAQFAWILDWCFNDTLQYDSDTFYNVFIIIDPATIHDMFVHFFPVMQTHHHLRHDPQQISWI